MTATISRETAGKIRERIAQGQSVRTISSDLRVSIATVSRYKGYVTTKTTTPTPPLVKRRLQELTAAFGAFERSPNRANYNAHKDALRAYEVARGKLSA